MATPAQWVEGMRPRTLPLSISPVIAGSAVALAAGGFHPWRALLTLIVGVAMQIGVNLSNDYSDGVRGTDKYRVGPQRLVGSGAASPVTVKRAAFIAYGVGCVAGLGLVWLTHLWWLVALGVVIVLAAWFYTGGKHPYGYVGLGEVFVFLFFGVAATAGTVLVQTGLAQHIWAVVAATLCQGTGACAVLVANNLRDIPTDAMAGKKTLSVRLGDAHSRALFVWLVAASALSLVATALLTHLFALLGLAMLFWAVPAVVVVVRGGKGLELVRVLKLVGLAQLVGAAGLFLGVLVAIAI